MEVPDAIFRLANSDGVDISVRIGRSGITKTLVKELSDQLGRRKIVKVKANKGVASEREQRSQIFMELAEVTNSILVFKRGNVAVFWSGK